MGKYGIYNVPIIGLVIITLIVTWFWCWFDNYCGINKYKLLRFVCRSFTVLLSLYGIYYYTLTNRTTPDVGDTFRLCPFYPIIFREMYPEYFRTLFMNVLLFYPFGLALAFIFHKNSIKKICMVTAIGFFLSLSVEYLQYRLTLGIFEMDDLICNTVGALGGAMAYTINEKMEGVKENG